MIRQIFQTIVPPFLQGSFILTILFFTREADAAGNGRLVNVQPETVNFVLSDPTTEHKSTRSLKPGEYICLVESNYYDLTVEGKTFGLNVGTPDPPTAWNQSIYTMYQDANKQWLIDRGLSLSAQAFAKTQILHYNNQKSSSWGSPKNSVEEGRTLETYHFYCKVFLLENLLDRLFGLNLRIYPYSNHIDSAGNYNRLRIELDGCQHLATDLSLQIKCFVESALGISQNDITLEDFDVTKMSADIDWDAVLLLFERQSQRHFPTNHTESIFDIGGYPGIDGSASNLNIAFSEFARLRSLRNVKELASLKLIEADVLDEIKRIILLEHNSLYESNLNQYGARILALYMCSITSNSQTTLDPQKIMIANGDLRLFAYDTKVRHYARESVTQLPSGPTETRNLNPSKASLNGPHELGSSISRERPQNIPTTLERPRKNSKTKTIEVEVTHSRTKNPHVPYTEDYPLENYKITINPSIWKKARYRPSIYSKYITHCKTEKLKSKYKIEWEGEWKRLPTGDNVSHHFSPDTEYSLELTSDNGVEEVFFKPIANTNYDIGKEFIETKH